MRKGTLEGTMEECNPDASNIDTVVAHPVVGRRVVLLWLPPGLLSPPPPP
eukprot:COSAG04_NODE_14775_length_555_cov_1.456140_1_plen_49_part_10